MKSVEQIVARLAERIGFVDNHPRPLTYGGTAEGVDLLLRAYHDMWSEIVGRKDEFQTVLSQVSEEANCDAAGFATRYLLDHRQATQEEAPNFVTRSWRLVSERLGVPIPHNRLKHDFDEFKARLASYAQPVLGRAT